MRTLIILAFAALSATGCDQLRGEATFPVTIANRSAHAIRVYANGKAIADVPAGKPAGVEVKLQTLRSYGVVGATEQAQAAFNAEDLATHRLSPSRPTTLVQDRPTHLEFTDQDFR